jgi:prevent-host-death family protein
MMKTWQLQEAKARLSQVIRQASTQGPQAITVRGSDEAVVLSAAMYHRLVGDQPSFLQFINRSPIKGVPLHVRRDRSGARRVDLG